MNLHTIDVICLTGYLGLIIAIGVFFSRKNTNTEEYFVGGRSFPGWAIGLSLVGTSISSITFLAYPGDAFKTSWIRFLPNLMLPLGVFIAAYFFLPRFREGRMTSAYEFLEKRFGPSIRVYGALIFIVAQVVRISLILYLLSLLVHELTGIDPGLCILLSGLFVAAYTVIGGIDAVIWTDVLQTVILALGGVLCLWVIIAALPGGLSQILDVGQAAGKLSFSQWENNQLSPLSWHINFSEKTITLLLLMGLVAWLTEYSANQNTVQRFCAARSTREARKGLVICAAASLPIWAFYMFLGSALFVFYQQFPDPLVAKIATGERKAEQILPYFIMNELPKGVVGLVIAAALAAAMSSIDSSLNAISTVSIVDIYRRHLNPHKTDRHYLRVAFLVAGIAAAITIVGALLLQSATTKTLQDTATILTSILGGGLLGLYCIGFFTRRGDARAVWCGLAATFCFTAWTLLVKHGLLPNALSTPFDLYYTGLFGNLVMFLTTYSVARWLLKPST